MNFRDLKIFTDKVRIILSLLLIIAVVGIWHYKVEPFHKLSLQTNDFKYSFNRYTPSQEIVFVSIDEKSVTKYGRWPWDRAMLAQKMQHLQGAKVVVLDMVFSENTNQSADEALGDAIFDLSNVVCGIFLRNDSTKVLNPDTHDILTDSALHRVFIQDVPFMQYRHAEVNIPQITQSCMLSGVFSTVSDSDALFRRYPIAYLFNENIYPSLGIQTLRYMLNKDISIEQEGNDYAISLDEREFVIDDAGFVGVNYYDINEYNMLSFSDIDDKDFDHSMIEDKIVILGVSEAGVSDIRATPLGQIPGPLIHYSFISNYLQDIVLQKYPQIELLFILLLSILPLFLHKALKQLSYRIVLYSVVAAGFIIGNIYLYSYGHIWIDIFYPLFGFILLLAFNSAFLFKARDKEQKFLKGAFGSYLSPKLLDEIIKDPARLQLGGEKRDVTIIFTDIRGFTTLSEKVSSQDLISILERYFTPMTEIVLNNSGTLDKYIGDAIMAFYNAPIEVKDHPIKAVKTALEMLHKLKDVNDELNALHLPSIDFGAGINTGEAVVGNIGSASRFDYSVIGDSVNLASRVEGLCKTYGVHIVITEFTKARIGDGFLTRELDDVTVKGKSKSVTVYEVMFDTPQNHEIKALYEKALMHYKKGEKQRAQDLFIQCHREYGDKPSQLIQALHFDQN